jgi:phosphosulfolactate synthase
VPTPSFLGLQQRPLKPRQAGLTHALDPGVSPATAAAALASASEFIDIWKIGWGTAYVDRTLGEKLAMLTERHVAVCLGGTLLEIAWARGKAAECLAWAADVGFRYVEVSRGTVQMTLPAKHELIRLAATRFMVLAEVGSKDPDQPPEAQEWSLEVASDLAAGASMVVTEGRQSGTVGTFDSSGRVREEVVQAVCDAVGSDKVIFEAPRVSQQAWFIRRFGADVNLGNIALDDVMSLETLRLGLRSDTSELALPATHAGPERVR